MSDSPIVFYVDIGTHRAQEYIGMFGLSSSALAFKLLRHNIRCLRKRAPLIPLINCSKMVRNNRELRRKRSFFYCIFVEPNRRLCSSPVYSLANSVFNLAISADVAKASLAPLYFSNSDRLGQGSSLFLAKPNIDSSDYEYVVNMDAVHFAEQLLGMFDVISSGSPFRVVLRVNNEGAEVEVVEAFYRVFGSRLVGVMGSLADVIKVKSQDALNHLMSNLASWNVPFIPLHSNIETWLSASDFLSAAVQRPAAGSSVGKYSG